MYFTSVGWARLWKREAQKKFKAFLEDYIRHFPEGGFGVVDNGQLVGAMWLLATDQSQPIPYLHDVRQFLVKGGKLGYVSFFAVRKGTDENKVAETLYQEAENVAKQLGFREIIVVIYKSHLEEETIKAMGYKSTNEKLQWEIYPGMFVPATIYSKQLG